MKCLSLLILFLFIVPESRAELKIFTRQLSDKFPKVPDLYNVKNPKTLKPLTRLKWFEKNKQWKSCLLLTTGQLKEKDLLMWVSALHLRCLKNLYQDHPKTSTSRLMDHFKKIQSSKGLLLSSPYEQHKADLLTTFLEIAEKSLSGNRSKIDNFLDQNHDLVDHMSKTQRARYYKILGEVAWQRQKNQLAVQNFLRSYSFNPLGSIRKRLKSLDSDHLLDQKEYQDDLTYSDAENKLWGQFRNVKKKNNYIQIAKRGVEYLNDYPGSGRIPQVADHLLLSLKRILYKGRKKRFQSLREDFLSTLKKAPGSYLSKWSDVAYQRGYYNESLLLSEKAISKLEEGQSAQALLIAGRSAYYLTKWSKAEDHFESLIEKYQGHKNSAAAKYLLGLLWYRKGSHKKVVALYDKFLLDSGSDLWELQIRFWLWRSLQQMNSSRAAEQAEAILKDFPLTYYGLQVRYETQKSLQTLLKEKVPKVEAKYWWSQESRQRWKRIMKLIEHAWVNEAEKEIDLLPSPTMASEYMLRAQLWTAAQRPHRAMVELNEAVHKDPRFLVKPFLEMAFPKDFIKQVKKSSSEFEMDKDLVFSVIRQESGFTVDAVSPSNAMGLMQLIPLTGRETARWLKVKGFRKRDLFKPGLNVRFGSHFLRRMIRKYKGVVPLALASYNVGPGNLDRWLNQRQDLKEWDKFGKQTIDDLWVDELPWAETSFYVKAILRNYLLYKIIFSGEDKLSTPVWNDAQSIVPYGKAS